MPRRLTESHWQSRRFGRCAAKILSNVQVAPQRITLSHRFDLGQETVVALGGHAGKFKRGRNGQPEPFRLGGIMRGKRMVGKNDQVCAQQLVALAGKRQLHPVSKKTDRSHATDGNNQCKCEHPQFPCTPIAAKHA